MEKSNTKLKSIVNQKLIFRKVVLRPFIPGVEKPMVFEHFYTIISMIFYVPTKAHNIMYILTEGNFSHLR